MTVTTEEPINYQRIEQAIQYLENNVQRQPDLEEVAEKVHLSAFHFQRIFTEWAGISPKRFLQYLTVDFLKSKLQDSKNLVEAAEAVGLSSQSRVYDLFTTLEAVTPLEYKRSGAGIRIDYGFHETPFGSCLLGVTQRGICWLSFLTTDEDPRYELEKMKEHWNHSVFYQNQVLSDTFVQRIFQLPSHQSLVDRPSQGVFGGPGGSEGGKLHLFVKGTNFQIKVWEALLRIPMGGVTTYQQIARTINNPKALQAVGSAVGSNHVAYLIPCHRVIRKNGVPGEYRWSATRKKSMIGWEMAKAS